jgi:hypothetical protein
MRPMGEDTKDKLFILWTSGDPEVAKHMVFMYAKNARLKGWWQTVRLIVWGPSASLLARDESLQAELAQLREAGVELQACKACADRYGVSEQLTALGVDVIYMGAPLTEYLKTGWASITI